MSWLSQNWIWIAFAAGVFLWLAALDGSYHHQDGLIRLERRIRGD
jgi:hypothetical protein